jgi:hypothetical protein
MSLAFTFKRWCYAAEFETSRPPGGPVLQRDLVEDLIGLIVQVKLGNTHAYEPIVRRFQDMAVAYGYAALGDWQLAEDAAQEAFIAGLT